MRGRFSCQRFLNALSKTTTTTTTTPKAALAGQRHHHLSSKAVGVPMANWKTKSLEEQETERSLRVRKSASCESTTESKTHQNVLLKSSLMFFGALRDAQKYNALIKPLVFVRYKHGKNKNKKKGGKRILAVAMMIAIIRAIIRAMMMTTTTKTKRVVPARKMMMRL
jgi:hypothetical protein